MKSIEIQAKTIEDATEQGLEKLGASYDEVEVEVLSSGGMFKKAKVRLTLKHEPKQKDEEQIKTTVIDETKPTTIEPQPTEQIRTDKTQKQRHEKKPRPAPDTSPAVKKELSDITSPKLQACVTFLTKLLDTLENDSTITIGETERSYVININGENVGRLIGKGGEAMNALQVIVSSIAISNSGGDQKRVYINIENYKEKREGTLKALALKKAEYVKKVGKSVRLDPMSPRDRAIVHTTLKEVEGIKTYSTGEGVARRLVIAPEKI